MVHIKKKNSLRIKLFLPVLPPPPPIIRPSIHRTSISYPHVCMILLRTSLTPVFIFCTNFSLKSSKSQIGVPESCERHHATRIGAEFPQGRKKRVRRSRRKAIMRLMSDGGRDPPFDVFDTIVIIIFFLLLPVPFLFHKFFFFLKKITFSSFVVLLLKKKTSFLRSSLVSTGTV